MSHNCQWVMFIVENFKVNLWVWQEFLFRTYPEEKMKERFKNKFDSNAYWYRFRSIDRPFWADGRSKGEIIIYISGDMAHTVWLIRYDSYHMSHFIKSTVILKTSKLHEHTPLIKSPKLSKICGREVLLKLDNLQPSGSFKIRGIGHLVQVSFY